MQFALWIGFRIEWFGRSPRWSLQAPKRLEPVRWRCGRSCSSEKPPGIRKTFIAEKDSGEKLSRSRIEGFCAGENFQQNNGKPLIGKLFSLFLNAESMMPAASRM